MNAPLVDLLLTSCDGYLVQDENSPLKFYRDVGTICTAQGIQVNTNSYLVSDPLSSIDEYETPTVVAVLALVDDTVRPFNLTDDGRVRIGGFEGTVQRVVLYEQIPPPLLTLEIIPECRDTRGALELTGAVRLLSLPSQGTLVYNGVPIESAPYDVSNAQGLNYLQTGKECTSFTYQISTTTCTHTICPSPNSLLVGLTLSVPLALLLISLLGYGCYSRNRVNRVFGL